MTSTHDFALIRGRGPMDARFPSDSSVFSTNRCYAGITRCSAFVSLGRVPETPRERLLPISGTRNIPGQQPLQTTELHHVVNLYLADGSDMSSPRWDYFRLMQDEIGFYMPRRGKIASNLQSSSVLYRLRPTS